MRRNSIIALACCLAIGCVDVKPRGGVTPSPGPGPAPLPTPDTATRRNVAASLTEATGEECRKLYGVFTALALYVAPKPEGSESPKVESTGQLLQLTIATLDNRGWTQGNYPRFTEAVRTEMNAKFKTPKPMKDARTEAAATYREIAAGCWDAGAGK